MDCLDRTNVIETGVDFLAFSAHKMLGPTGIGVLYGKYENRDNGHNPGLDIFNKEIYLKLYKDVCDSASDPWYHYIMYGKNEGRYSGVFCKMITKIVSSTFSTN